MSTKYERLLIMHMFELIRTRERTEGLTMAKAAVKKKVAAKKKKPMKKVASKKRTAKRRAR